MCVRSLLIEQLHQTKSILKRIKLVGNNIELETKQSYNRERGISGLWFLQTFMLLVRYSHFLHLLGRLHEQREYGPQAQDVHKLVTVIRPLWTDHPVVQDLQRADSRHLLLPEQT